MDFLCAIGMKFDFDRGVIQWLDIIVDMKNVQEFKNFLNMEDIGPQPKDMEYFNQLQQLNEAYGEVEEEDFLCNEAWDSFATEILE